MLLSAARDMDDVQSRFNHFEVAGEDHGALNRQRSLGGDRLVEITWQRLLGGDRARSFAKTLDALLDVDQRIETGP